MRIAYLINQYPKVSHSFIRWEILALEQQGFEIIRIALRGWDGDLVDDADRMELSRTNYVLRNGGLGLLFPLIRHLFTRPLNLFRTAVLACRMSRGSERTLVYHLIYVAEACWVYSLVQASGACHLHAHFGTNSAEIAMMTNALGGPPWSFTAHGTETFDNPFAIGLTEKLKRCTFVAAVSSYGRAQLFRHLKRADRNKVHLIRCGLDAEYIELMQTPVPERKRLICVARLSEEKGHILLLEAARCLATQNVEFELVLAGDGDLRGELEAIISQHGLQHKISITGWIDSRQVRNELERARALVLPSFAEGLPVVVMEAMAASRPIISTFVGGIPELVAQGLHGWLVPAGDVATLTEAMRSCLEAPSEQLTKMGAAAREHVLTRHDAEKEAWKIGNLFKSTGPDNCQTSDDEGGS